MTDHDDEAPTEEELREAEALARALERGTAGPELPEDALAAANVLAYARDGGALPPVREQAILDGIVATAKPPGAADAPKERAGWLRWLLPAFGLAGAAAALALVLLADPPPSGAARLPTPGADLLSAQAGAATGNADDAVVLGARMRDYRGEMFATLEEHYGAR